MNAPAGFRRRSVQIATQLGKPTYEHACTCDGVAPHVPEVRQVQLSAVVVRNSAKSGSSAKLWPMGTPTRLSASSCDVCHEKRWFTLTKMVFVELSKSVREMAHGQNTKRLKICCFFSTCQAVPPHASTGPTRETSGEFFASSAGQTVRQAGVLLL